jgi:hypothetical protein
MISDSLRQNNPELLDIAAQCAAHTGERDESMLGFCVFYRLLLAQAAADGERPWAHAPRAQFDPLPRVTPQTRAAVVRAIGERGAEAFTRDAVEELERSNPALLQVAHRFAARTRDYLGAMQGFALVYACLARQCDAERARVH